MKKENRSVENIKNDIRSAGQSFLGIRMRDLLNRIDELDDKDSKTKLIEEYFNNQVGTYDKNIGGTRTRVNSAIRIIKAEKVEYVLSMINGSDERVIPEAVQMAKQTLADIYTGKIKLPVLE